MAAIPSHLTAALMCRSARLRQRLGDDAREARLIKTVRGEGYVFTAPVSLSGEPACD